MTSDPVRPGRLTVHLEPGQRLGPARVPGADLTLRVRAGGILVDRPARADRGVGSRRVPVHVGSGEALPLPRGTAFAVRAGVDGATLEVTARPPGPERFVALAARRPAQPLAALVAAAVEQGVELLPSDLHAAENPGEGAR